MISASAKDKRITLIILIVLILFAALFIQLNGFKELVIGFHLKFILSSLVNFYLVFLLPILINGYIVKKSLKENKLKCFEYSVFLIVFIILMIFASFIKFVPLVSTILFLPYIFILLLYPLENKYLRYSFVIIIIIYFYCLFGISIGDKGYTYQH